MGGMVNGTPPPGHTTMGVPCCPKVVAGQGSGGVWGHKGLADAAMRVGCGDAKVQTAWRDGVASNGVNRRRVDGRMRAMEAKGMGKQRKDASEKKTWKYAVTPSKRAVDAAVLAPVETDADAVAAVGVVAGRLGHGGGSFEEMAQTWLRPIVDEGYGTTKQGLNRARCAVKFLGLLLEGRRHGEAMAEAGLTWGLVTAFRFACPGFADVYAAARGAMKEAMGAKVLETAYDLATEGAEVRGKDGEVVGKKKSEKMLDRLLVMSGKEFRKDKGAAAAGAPGRPGQTLIFQFGGKPQRMEVTDV